MRFCNVRIVERKGKSTATKEAKRSSSRSKKEYTAVTMRGAENHCNVVACGERRLEPITSSLITNRTNIEMSKVYL